MIINYNYNTDISKIVIPHRLTYLRKHVKRVTIELHVICRSRLGLSFIKTINKQIGLGKDYTNLLTCLR